MAGQDLFRKLAISQERGLLRALLADQDLSHRSDKDNDSLRFWCVHYFLHGSSTSFTCIFSSLSSSAMKRGPSSESQLSKARRVMAAKRSLPHTSQSAFASMVHLAKTTDLSDFPISRAGYTGARNSTLVDTPYGPMVVMRPLVPKPPHAPRQMVAINPLAYLHTAFRSGGGFFKLLQSSLRSNPPSVEKPWRLCLYADEVVPGNQLAVRHARKVWVVYFSFLELHLHLSNERAWCPLVAEPSDGLKTVSGGISQVIAELIKLFFNDNFDLRYGMQLDGPDGENVAMRLFVALSMFLQDGGAHKLLWGCKGDSGTRMCMLCTNLVALASGIAIDGENVLVCNIIHEDQLRFATDDCIRAALRRLEAFKVTETKGDFKLRQQAIGFTYQEHGVLQDPSLVGIVFPVSQYCHDWMHCIFASGVFNIIVLLCFTSAKKTSTNVWSELREYVLKHTWPKTTTFNPSSNDHFLPDRIKAHTKAGLFKCPASDGLALLPVMCLCVLTVVLRDASVDKAACEALVALCDLVNALVCVPLGLVSADCLRQRIMRLLAICETAGWAPHFIPKFHWLIHLIKALERWGVLPTCWVHERKHKVAKRFGTDIRNTTSYSRSVLLETISQQLFDVEDPCAFDLSHGLLKSTLASKKVRNFLATSLQLPPELEYRTSVTARLSTGSLCAKTDCVLIKSNDGINFVAGQVWLLADCTEGVEVALISHWDFISYNQAIGNAVWRIADRAMVIQFSDIVCSVIWSEITPGIAVTLVPFQFQGMQAVAE